MPAPKRKVMKASFKTKTASPTPPKFLRPALDEPSSDEEPISVSIAKRRKTTSPKKSTTPQRGTKEYAKRPAPASPRRRTPDAVSSRVANDQSSVERHEASNIRFALQGQSASRETASPAITIIPTNTRKLHAATKELLPTRDLQLVLNDPVTVQGLPFQPIQKMVDLVWEQIGDQSGRLVLN